MLRTRREWEPTGPAWNNRAIAPMFGERFELIWRLGIGGMGVVYEAEDRAIGRRVAVKTLRNMSPTALLRFKQEFRALSDLDHPNLVKLGELIEHDGFWFFTMELVDGCDLVEWVSGPRADDHLTVTAADTPLTPRAVAGGAAFDEQRLRDSTAQLARGLTALHRRGKVHRDIKPCNVRVTPEGRVVLLDFGLVADPEEAALSSVVAVGTPAYMAPEQAARAQPTPAADWYAVGVVLYELLVGGLPYSHAEARRFPPVRPSALVPGVPMDLETLCLSLLRHDPAQRPTGAEVMAALDQRALPREQTPSESSTELGIAGRCPQLAELAAAADDVRAGRPIVAIVDGPGGAGKTSLLRRFARERAAAGALVLTSRCRDRELVPYRALDGTMDALANHLAELAPEDLVTLLPPELGILCETFPAFASVPFERTVRELRIPDLRERRVGLFRAVRDLFSRLAARRPLVLICDDFQAADTDSMALLGEIFAPPDPPAVLLVACRRSTGTGQSAGLRAHPLTRLPVSVREIHIDAPPATVSAEDSGTRPCASMISERIARLAPAEREILALLALSGAPVLPSILCHAAQVEDEELRRLVQTLRSAALVGHSGAREWFAYELVDESVREAARALLTADETGELHERLAIALDDAGGDPAQIAEQWAGAGDPTRAAASALRAARAAEQALALDRAAGLYRRALELGCSDATERGGVEEALGDVLAGIGRGVEAADAYLRASRHAEPTRAMVLERRAARQLLSSGRTDRGLAVARRVLGAVGIRVPSSPLRAGLRALRHGAELALLRLRPPVDRAPPPSELLRQIDALDAFSLGVGAVEVATGAALQFQQLGLAVRAGEPGRIARSLALVAPYAAAAGRAGGRLAARQMQEAARLAANGDDREFEARLTFSSGFSALQCGRWRTACELSERAEVLYRENCINVAGDLAFVRVATLWALYFLGELGELSRRAPPLVREALERNDILAATNLRLGPPSVARLVGDDPDGARRDVDQAITAWTRSSYDAQRFFEVFARCQIDFYTGSRSSAHERVSHDWAPLQRSLLPRLQLLRVLAHDLRARAALAAVAAGAADRAKLLAAAQHDAVRLGREGASWCDGLAHLVRAGVSDLGQGGAAAARGHLAAAAIAFDDAGMQFHAAVCRLRAAELAPRGEDPARAARANAWIAEQRVANPAAMIRMLTPWWP